MNKKSILLSVVFSGMTVLSLPSFADVLANTETLADESKAPIMVLRSGYSMTGEKPIVNIQSSILLSCIKKQISEYNKAAESFPGGTDAFAQALFKNDMQVRMSVYDFSRDKRSAVTALETDNIFPDPTVISESSTKIIRVIGSIGINPKTRDTECKIQSSEDMVKLFSQIKELGFKALKPKASGQSKKDESRLPGAGKR